MACWKKELFEIWWVFIRPALFMGINFGYCFIAAYLVDTYSQWFFALYLPYAIGLIIILCASIMDFINHWRD